MPVSALATVLLRLLAFYWLVVSVIGGGAALLRYINHTPGDTFTLAFAGAILPVLVAGNVWHFAPALGRRIARHHDQCISLEGVTREDLYAVTILGIGLYLAISSLGQTINWVHFFATQHDQTFGFLIRSSPSYYDLSEPLITFAAGFGLVLSAKAWARKLA